MKSVSIQIIILLEILTIICHGQTTFDETGPSKKVGIRRCQNLNKNQQMCLCGRKQVTFNPQKGEKCINGQVISKGNYNPSNIPKSNGLRIITKALHQSARDDNDLSRCIGLRVRPPSDDIESQLYVPLQNVSVETWIDSYAADVTLTQVYINQEKNPIEAIYVFPIEENAAVYSFTAQIDDRIITAELKEKKTAEKEYQQALNESKTAILLRQSQETLDTFTINVGALQPGKECRVTIKYVTELDLIDGESIRFVVPTTIAPRYNPSLGHLQSPDKTETKYVQKTPYSMSFKAHVLRGEQYKIMQVANLSHPVNVNMTDKSIDVSLEGIALDRDIILDIDLPKNRPMTIVATEQYDDKSKYAILLGFTPRLNDFIKISNGKQETNNEFIFIVDCSGSMDDANGIGLAREAMLLFIRSLPVGSNFNIIRFGSNFDILFKNEKLTTVYDENTAKQAESLTHSMEANFGGTELLQPLLHLKDHPPIIGRSRQIFLLTDGEISNTNEVIELCRSMSSNTRIFSFGLGHSPSRSLVKGLARATNGHFVFVPPNGKVDTYVGSQLGRALQPSILNARLQWHGLSSNGLQAPTKIPPLYINDRVLVYQLLENENFQNQNIVVDVIVDEMTISTIKIPKNILSKQDTIRRLAAKALIQELQHNKQNSTGENDNSTMEQQITKLSLDHKILSPYTAFVGVETISHGDNNLPMQVRHIPIQISKGDEHLLFPQSSFSHYFDRNRLINPVQTISGTSSFVQQSLHYDSLYENEQRDDEDKGYSSDFRDAQSLNDYVANDSMDVTTTTKATSLATDPVRWLIDQQSFNGAWILDESDIQKLTNGKSINTFTSTITHDKDAITTAIAIAVLESKHIDQKNLWHALVEKGRKQLTTTGLSNDQINKLINEIKNKL